MSEEWRTIADYPDYAVSSLGRVKRIVDCVRRAGRWRAGHTIKASTRKGYWRVNLRKNGKLHTCFVHRLIGKAFLGLKNHEQIDHRFHDTTDNLDIRVATPAQNTWNSRGRRNASSCFKGVAWHAKVKKWQACIHTDGRNKYLGLFRSETEAARAYDAAASKAYGEFAFLNFPDDAAEALQQRAAE